MEQDASDGQKLAAPLIFSRLTECSTWLVLIGSRRREEVSEAQERKEAPGFCSICIGMYNPVVFARVIVEIVIATIANVESGSFV